MSLYTIEISGRPILVFTAETLEDAEDYRDSPALHEDLLSHEHAGSPLWDGDALLFLRLAEAEEDAKWQVSFAKGREEGDAEAGGDWAAFLVDVREAS